MKQLDELAEKVWLKGEIVTEKDNNGNAFSPDEWRRDDDGKAIRHDDYGNRDSDFGWEIDHIRAVSDGGSDDIRNLRPLYWKTNVTRN